jgi:hypothetical protein
MRFPLILALFMAIGVGCGSKPPPPPAQPAPAPAPPPAPPAENPNDAKDIDPSTNPDAGNEAEDAEKTDEAKPPAEPEPAALLWVMPSLRRG